MVRVREAPLACGRELFDQIGEKVGGTHTLCLGVLLEQSFGGSRQSYIFQFGGTGFCHCGGVQGRWQVTAGVLAQQGKGENGSLYSLKARGGTRLLLQSLMPPKGPHPRARLTVVRTAVR